MPNRAQNGPERELSGPFFYSFSWNSQAEQEIYTPPGIPRSRSFTRFTMRVGLLHFGQSVLLDVSITFLRSAVLAILAMNECLLQCDKLSATGKLTPAMPALEKRNCAPVFLNVFLNRWLHRNPNSADALGMEGTTQKNIQLAI